jgi:hypothetical protein
MSNLIENTETYIKKHFKTLKLSDTCKEEVLQKYPNPKSFVKMYFDGYCPATESVNKNGTRPKNCIVTENRRNRSIPDVYTLLTYYYPNIKLQTFLKYLEEGVKKNKIGQSYCHDIKRIVLYKGHYYHSKVFSNTYEKVWKSKNSPTFGNLISYLHANE